MPGVIQPNRPQSSLGNVMSLAQTAKGFMGGGGGGGSAVPTQSPTADPMATDAGGSIGGPSQAAQGQAVTPYQAPMGDYQGGGNVFQRRMQRSY